MATGDALPAALADWIEAEAGAVSFARRLAGGNRREAWQVDAGGRALFLRFDESDRDDPFTIRREAGVYRALLGSDVLIPRFVAVHPVREAMLVERAEGEVAYARIPDAAAKQAIARHLVEELAKLHALDPATLDTGLGAPRSIAQHCRDEVAVWEGLYRVTGRGDALIEFGARWLNASIPDPAGPAVLVHGDAGPGNFLHDGQRVTAMLDWELSHLGDPMEDIAWLSMRSVLEPTPDFLDLLGAYRAASGRNIDLARVRFHRVLVQWRIAIIRHRLAGGDPANSLISWAMNRRLLVEALADVMRAAPALPPMPDQPATAQTDFYGHVLAMLRDDIAPGLQGRASAKAKSVARLVKYLERQDRIGPALRAQELGEIAALLGRGIGDQANAREAIATAIREGVVSDADALAHLAAQAARDTELMRPAMGAIADRHFPPLEPRP